MAGSSTSERRFPWWMYVVGLSYLITLGVILYLIFLGPAELQGFNAAFTGDAMLIRSVQPDSHVARNGLRAGDRVLAIDDKAMAVPRAWTETTGNFQVGRPQRWMVVRGNDRLILEIAPEPSTFQSRLLEGYVQYLSLL